MATTNAVKPAYSQTLVVISKLPVPQDCPKKRKGETLRHVSARSGLAHETGRAADRRHTRGNCEYLVLTIGSIGNGAVIPAAGPTGYSPLFFRLASDWPAVNLSASHCPHFIPDMLRITETR